MKILPSAFAHAPKADAVAGAGVGWAEGVASYQDVTVVTDMASRELIDAMY